MTNQPVSTKVPRVKNAEDAQRMTMQYVKTWRKSSCEYLVMLALDEIELKASKGHGCAYVRMQEDHKKYISNMFIQEMEALGFQVRWFDREEDTLELTWMDASQLEAVPR